MARIWICCEECGSRHVTKDATTHWSVEDQQWEISTLYDKPNYCCDCEAETYLEEVPIVADIEGEIREMGFGLQRRSTGLFIGERNFEEPVDAYLWARTHTKSDAQSQ